MRFILYRLTCRFEMKLELKNSSQIGLFLIEDEQHRCGSSSSEGYGRGRWKTMIVAVFFRDLYGYNRADTIAAAVSYGYNWCNSMERP